MTKGDIYAYKGVFYEFRKYYGEGVASYYLLDENFNRVPYKPVLQNWYDPNEPQPIVSALILNHGVRIDNLPTECRQGKLWDAA